MSLNRMVFVFIFAIALNGGCSTDTYHRTSGRTLPIEKFPLYIGLDRSQVTEMFGKPDIVKTINNGKMELWYFNEGGIVVVKEHYWGFGEKRPPDPYKRSLELMIKDGIVISQNYVEMRGLYIEVFERRGDPSVLMGHDGE